MFTYFHTNLNLIDKPGLGQKHAIAVVQLTCRVVSNEMCADIAFHVPIEYAPICGNQCSQQIPLVCQTAHCHGQAFERR